MTRKRSFSGGWHAGGTSLDRWVRTRWGVGLIRTPRSGRRGTVPGRSGRSNEARSAPATFQAGGQATPSVVGFDSSAVIPTRRWTHVAYVLKGGAALSLYINGVRDCPMISSNRRGGSCPPGGGSFAWDEGDVLHNAGPLYVGADPFMSGAAMFMDSLKVFNLALPEKDIVAEASDALGLLGARFLRLGCANCTVGELQGACAELDEFHPCLCQELMGGGLTSARAMGWLRGPSASWRFHAEVQNTATCLLEGADASGPAGRPGFCCAD